MQTAGEVPSYASIAAKMNAKMLTLGLVPTFLRNVILLAGVQPSKQGIADDASSVLLALGAVTLSHPFEVARVHQQYAGDMNFDFRGTL